MAKVGGTGAVQAADAKIQELADKVLAASVAARSNIPSLCTPLSTGASHPGAGEWSGLPGVQGRDILLPGGSRTKLFH